MVDWRKQKKMRKAELRRGGYIREKMGYSVSGARKAYIRMAERKSMFRYLGWFSDRKEAKRLANEIQ